MPRRPLYEPHPDYPDRVKLPLHLYGGGTVQPGETVAISIGSRTTTEALCDFELRNMIEDQITDLFLGLPSSQVVFAEQFGMSGSKLWCIVRAPRHVLLPSSKEGQPGDFDAIVGRIVDDTYVDLSTLCLVEFKVGKAPPTSEAARSALPKFATSKGTKQAGAAAELGFDFVLLAHFLVRDAGECQDRCRMSVSC